MNFGKQEKPSFIRKDSRGSFKELINSGQWQGINYGTMYKGSVMGRHYHKKTIVAVYLISGKAEIKTFNIQTREKKVDYIKSDQGYIFRPEEVRIINYLEDSLFLLLKSHFYDANNPDKIYYPEDF